MDEVKKVLFVGLHRPYRSPSQRYRIEQFLPALDKANISYDYSYILDEKKDAIFYTKGRYFGKLLIVLSGFFKRLHEVLFRAKKYDYIFVQREAFMLGTAFFEKQYAKKSKLIFDFDDAIWMPNVSDANKHLAFLKNPNKTKSIIACAHTVVVGNQYLKDYALQFNKNIRIIPTVVDTDFYKIEVLQKKENQTRICIGWSGSLTTIAHFKLLIPVLERLKNKYNDCICFKVIGSEQYENKDLGIRGIPWSLATETSNLEGIDIGVMPISEDEWSKGKCGLKGLVYMSMGIPNVMTNFGVNMEIVENGKNGFLCSNEDEWFSVLSQLIENKSLRLTIGAAGRKTVEQNYSVHAQSQAFLSLFCV
jgi:glycosyltransferase involved in cell wall biosynthesis